MKILFCSFIAATAAGAVASPFATTLLSYDAGANANPSYTNASSALGSAARTTGSGAFASGVTPFNPAFRADQLVSVGSGGHLTLGFDAAITNNASHRFGVDLIIFGNAFFVDQSFFDTDPTNDGSGVLGAEPAVFGSAGIADVFVSADGIDWRLAAVTGLNLFPTLAYSDFTQTTPGGPGLLPTDYTRAIDPATTLASLANLSFAELIARYDGSGGGVGIDIASTGLTSARFVRIENNSNAAFNIDAVGVVPAPASVLALAGIGLLARRRR
jgi:hypothetical protein